MLLLSFHEKWECGDVHHFCDIHINDLVSISRVKECLGGRMGGHRKNTRESSRGDGQL